MPQMMPLGWAWMVIVVMMVVGSYLVNFYYFYYVNVNFNLVGVYLSEANWLW